MAIYLDSANPDDARQAQNLGFVHGITTNPRLMAQTGRPPFDVLSELVEVFEGHVFYQVTAPTLEERTDEAWKAYKIRPDKVIIKVPATSDNISLVSRLVPAGIECAMTAVYSPAQAFLASEVRASFVIPYFNRMQRLLDNADRVLQDITTVLAESETETLVASFKSLDEITAALRMGIRHLTLPLDLILTMGDHRLTQQAIDEFSKAEDKLS